MRWVAEKGLELESLWFRGPVPLVPLRFSCGCRAASGVGGCSATVRVAAGWQRVRQRMAKLHGGRGAVYKYGNK